MKAGYVIRRIFAPSDIAPSKEHDVSVLWSFLLRPGGASYDHLVCLPNTHSLRIRRAHIFHGLTLGGVDLHSLAAVDRGMEADGCQRGYIVALGSLVRPTRNQDG